MDGLDPAERRLYAVVALVAGLVNLFAIAAMGLILAPSTPAGGSIEARVEYLVANRPLVAFGWLLWVGATLTLLATFVALRRIGLALTADTPRPAIFRPILDYTVALAAVGATADIAANLLMMSVLPALAEVMRTAPGDPALIALFRTWDDAAVNLTGGVANSLYAVAGGIVTWVLAQGRAPKHIVWLGTAAWTVAALATGALAFWPAALPASITGALFLFIAWAWLIGTWLWLPDRAASRPSPRGHSRRSR